MTTVLLIRHGRTTANTQGVLAGWSAGVELDESGKKQIQSLAARLQEVNLARLVTSPLERCQQTAEIIESANRFKPAVEFDERLAECRYGEWEGKKLSKLAKHPLWASVQETPSAVHFPGENAESLLNVSRRANEAVRYWTSLAAPTRKNRNPVIALVSHGDVIKSILADALGMHLDMFQRIIVDPGSVSIVRYTAKRPFVVATNVTDSDFNFLAQSKKHARQKGESKGDAQVGGGAGVRT